MRIIRAIRRFSQWLDNSLFGDVIGAISLSVTLYLLIFFAGILS